MNHILDTNFEENEESQTEEIKNRCIDLKLLTNKWLQRKIW